MKDKPNLDLLRTFAVLCVLADHISISMGTSIWHGLSIQWLGVFGVYLFFVHTSLVLMWSLERQPHVLNFYIRRAFRIYPLALAALAVAMVVRHQYTGGFTLLDMTHPMPRRMILANILLVQNLIGGANIVGVMWSLCLEVQMYLVLPMLYFYAVRERRFWPLLVLWTLSVAAAYQLLPYVGNNLPTVVPDFLPGVIAFIAFARFKAVLPWWTFPVFLVVLSLVFLQSPGPGRSWPIALLLGLTLPLFRQLPHQWMEKFLHVVAKYSYGIYLGHSFILMLVWRRLGSQPALVQIGVELAGTFVVAVLGYHLIEEPMIRYGSRLAKRNDAREARQALTVAA